MTNVRKCFLLALCFLSLLMPVFSHAEAHITLRTPSKTATPSPSPSVSATPAVTEALLPTETPGTSGTALPSASMTPSPSPSAAPSFTPVPASHVTEPTSLETPGASPSPTETPNPVPTYQPAVTLEPLAETDQHYALPIDFSPGIPPRTEGYRTDYEYEDPTIHVRIERGRENDCTFWVCEVRIADPSQLRSASADGFESNMVMPGTAIAKRVNAVVAIDGDYFCYTGRGYILRQGFLYLDKTTGGRDVLLIDEDGDFHIVRKAKRNECKDTINGKKIINAFFFGPVLVENGILGTEFRYTDMAYDLFSQRMAIAQIGKLHYKIICCESPKRGSTGMTLKQFALFCQEKGVHTAYNLDGGDSTMLIFRDEKLNDVDNPHTRDIADIIYFASAYQPEK